VLVAAAQEGHQRDMDVDGVFPSHLQSHLPGRLQKRLGFDIAGGAADLGDDHVRPSLAAHGVNKVLDLVGNMGDDLHRLPQILAPALLVEHVPVDLAGGEIGVFVQILVDEPLVVAQIQIRLGPVVGDVDLAVLIGAHGAGIHIDIGVQLLGRHLQTSGLQQPAQRRGGYALAQSGNHAARHENVFGHKYLLRSDPCQTLLRKQKNKNAFRCLYGGTIPLASLSVFRSFSDIFMAKFYVLQMKLLV